MTSFIFQDWEANSGNPKGRFLMGFFRVCQLIRRLPSGWWILGSPVLATYVLIVHWLMGVEIDYRSFVGPGLALHHGTGLVVHPSTVIGARCTLRHGVTLGNRPPREGAPLIGDGVEFGVNALILGPVRVGNRAVIGAGAVVIHDVDPGCVVVGNPARVIPRNEPVS